MNLDLGPREKTMQVQSKQYSAKEGHKEAIKYPWKAIRDHKAIKDHKAIQDHNAIQYHNRFHEAIIDTRSYKATHRTIFSRKHILFLF